MLRTLLSRVHSLLPAGLIAAALALFSPGVVNAQSPGTYIPPDVKGFRATQMRQDAIQETARHTVAAQAVTVHHSATTQPAEVHIAINIPGNWNPPASLAIRGPEGDVRTFAVEGGRDALQSRVVVVRPGDRITVQLTPARQKNER